MDIDSLRYFLSVAREENMTRAAEILHVTQPTLSRQISKLEEELGCSLFERTNRSTMLTEEGMHLRKRAEEIISMVERTEMEFMTHDEDIYGDIHIGAGETRFMKHITEACAEVRRIHPNIRFHIYSATADELTERLDRGIIDFGFLFEPVSNREKFDYMEFPLKETTGLLTRKDSHLAERQVIRPEDLINEPLIVTTRLLASENELARNLGLKENELNIAATGNLPYNISKLVESGVGSAVMIDGLIDTSERSPLAFVPLERDIFRTLIFAWKKYQVLSPACELFLDRVRKVIEDI